MRAYIGAIGRALQAGTDYVKMTTMPQCCKLCAAYQDKVYCISGKDKRFPALFKTVLRSGYALPHPNCRHEFIPWFIEMEDPADVEKAIKNSKIKYDSKGNLVDVRFQKDIESYAAWQAGNRQLNREMLEFQRMQEHYAKKERPAPYTTLGSFRKARRSNTFSPAFKKWRYRNADKNQYERWKEIIGEKYMPKSVDDFQEIKYNKNKQREFENLKQIREQEIVYDIALNGGKHSGKLKNFQTYKLKGLKKSVKSYNETIDLHYKKIEKPWEYCTDWESRSEQYKQGLIKDWKKDIKRNKEQRDIVLALIRRLEDEE